MPARFVAALAFAAALMHVAAPAYSSMCDGQHSHSEELAISPASIAEPATTDQSITSDGIANSIVDDQGFDAIANAPAVSPEHTAEVMRDIPVTESFTALAAITSWHLFDEDEEELFGLLVAKPTTAPVETTSSIPAQ